MFIPPSKPPYDNYAAQKHIHCYHKAVECTFVGNIIKTLC